MKNYWSEFEYSKLKLLLNDSKVASLLRVLNGKSDFDAEPPISVELHLTNDCNLNCLWCTDSGLKQQKAANEKENIFRLFDHFAENNVGVTIEGGGEPSVHEDFEEIIEYGHKKGLHMGLISNGVKDFSALIKHFKWVRISVDAPTPEQYKLEKSFDRFDEVVSNLEKFSTGRDPETTQLGVGYVLTKRNTDGLVDFIKRLDQIGVDNMYIRPVEEAPEIEPAIESLLDLKSEIIKLNENMRLKVLLIINERFVLDNNSLPCFAHSLSCIIQANGKVALCEKRRHDPVIIGSINEQSFDDIWNSEIRKKASGKLLDPKNQHGCGVCRITSFNETLYNLERLNTKNFI